MPAFKPASRRHLTLALAGLGLACALAPAWAQSFPSKQVTLVVPFPPGGGPDVAARVIAEKLAPRLGQPVVVENRPGAGALLGASKLPAALEAARKSPGLPYGSAGNGSPMHFAGEMFKRSAGVDVLHVPYKGVAPSLNAALAGEVKLLYTGVGGALQHIKAGKLVPLALTEKARSALLPDVPTATEQGVANVEVNAWYGVFAPAATPAAVVQRINQEINAVIRLADVRERLLGAGIEPLGGTAQVLADFMKADTQRYGQLARELGIKAD